METYKDIKRMKLRNKNLCNSKKNFVGGWIQKSGKERQKKNRRKKLSRVPVCIHRMVEETVLSTKKVEQKKNEGKKMILAHKIKEKGNELIKKAEKAGWSEDDFEDAKEILSAYYKENTNTEIYLTESIEQLRFFLDNFGIHLPKKTYETLYYTPYNFSIEDYYPYISQIGDNIKSLVEFELLRTRDIYIRFRTKILLTIILSNCFVNQHFIKIKEEKQKNESKIKKEPEINELEDELEDDFEKKEEPEPNPLETKTTQIDKEENTVMVTINKAIPLLLKKTPGLTKIQIFEVLRNDLHDITLSTVKYYLKKLVMQGEIKVHGKGKGKTKTYFAVNQNA
jgi:hypothetical protein